MRGRRHRRRGRPYRWFGGHRDETSTAEVTLDLLQVGEGGVVVDLGGERQMRRRLMEMGLLAGSRLRVVKLAPAGDPIQIQVNDYFLSIRRSEAATIIVQPD